MSRSNELKKVLKDSNFQKVGRINKRVADKAHIKCADVYIHENGIKHIILRHSKELNQLGMTPLLYVKMIMQNYCEIRVGSNGTLLLIVDGKDIKHTTAIELKYVRKFQFWEVRTAQPRSVKDIEKREKLW
jgi:hypothetical protein